jgi:tellurite resistance protein
MSKTVSNSLVLQAESAKAKFWKDFLDAPVTQATAEEIITPEEREARLGKFEAAYRHQLQQICKAVGISPSDLEPKS